MNLVGGQNSRKLSGRGASPGHLVHEPSLSDAHDDRYRQVRFVTVLGGLLDAVLGIAKITVGIASHSQALIADGVHSLSDLGTDMLVLFAAKQASRDADEEHPYGHQRVETIATVLLSLALTGIGVGIAFDAIHRLFHIERLLQPGLWALVVAALSILSKETIYQYTLRAAKRLRSKMLRANAWHSRSDALSSVVVMVGVAGTMAGLQYLDAVAAVLVAVMIAQIGWSLGWQSIRELIDTGLEHKQLESIRDVILSVEGVRALHQLRTRRMGANVLVDVHVLVDPRLSVSEGHHIGDKVEEKLVQEIEDVTDLTVHIDPEDDATRGPSAHLPLRGPLLTRLKERWKDIPGTKRVDNVTLHYLRGEVQVEVWIPILAVSNLAQAKDLCEALSRVIEQEPEVGKVDVLFHC